MMGFGLGSWPNGLGYVEQYLYNDQKNLEYRQEPWVFTSTPTSKRVVHYVLRR